MSSVPSGSKHSAAGLPARLALASLCVTLPLLLFAVLLAWRQGTELREREALALEQRTDAAAHAVGQRVARAVSVLQTLGTSAAARSGDVEQLYAQARRVIDVNPDASAIGLSRRDGSQVFTTMLPLGTPLPASRGARYERAVFDEMRTVVTPLFVQSVSQRLVAMVAVPLRLDGRVAYSLRMTLPPATLEGLLRTQGWPADWTVSLVDDEGMIAARLPAGGRFVGTLAAAPVREAIARATPGLIDGDDENGVRMRVRLTPVPGTGWHLAVGVARSAFGIDRRRGVASLLVVGLASLAVGAGLAAGLARRALREEARGARPTLRPANGARRTDSHVNGAGAACSAEGGDAGTTVDARLGDGRTDPLTGLPGREVFREQALALAQRVCDDPSRRLAVMMVDLDGLRAINDAFGHDAGDAAVQRAARTLRAVLRDDDVAARFGGDEFAICIDCSRADLQATCRGIATRLIEGIAQVGQGLGCSIGIAVSNESRAPIDALVSTAEAAMSMAKRSGSNTFQVVGQ